MNWNFQYQQLFSEPFNHLYHNEIPEIEYCILYSAAVYFRCLIVFHNICIHCLVEIIELRIAIDCFLCGLLH